METTSEPFQLLTEYFRNDYFRVFLPIFLIVVFSVAFYVIYQIGDAFIDKEKHYKLAFQIAGNYQTTKARSKNRNNEYTNNSEQSKENYELSQVNSFL